MADERAEASAVVFGSGTEVLWQPHPGPQTEFLRRREFEAAYGGAKGGGKTDALLYGALRFVQHPRYHAAIFRRTYPELQELIDRSRASFPKLGAVWNETRHRWTFPSGARVSFFHCVQPGDEDLHLGKEYQYIAIDQVEQFLEGQYQKLLTCARTSAPGLEVYVRCSFNPGGPGHAWVRRRFYDLGPMTPYTDPDSGLTRIFVPARVWDNPTLLAHDPGYVQRLLSISDPQLRRAYLEGDMDLFAGQYFSEWRDAVHVVDPFELPEGWPRLGGLDWGYAPHPGVLLLLAFDPHGRAWAYREYVFREEPPEHLAEILAEEVLQDPAEREATIYADNVIWGRERDRGPSIAEVVSRELRRRGCSVRLVPADKARAVGWARVHDYLDPRRAQPDGSQGPWLRVFRRAGGAKSGSTIGCPYLIETLPAQVHDPHRPGDLLKAGREDDTDHAVDALRYALVSRPRLPPLDVQVAGAERRHAAYVHQVLRERLAAAIAARQGGHGRETVSAPDTLATWQDWL